MPLYWISSFGIEIDRGEGYSSSLDWVSISHDQNTLFSQFFLKSQRSVSHLCILRQFPLWPPHLPFFPSSTRLSVAQIPSLSLGLESLQMGALPHSLINSWGGLPNYQPNYNSFLIRRLFWSWEIKRNIVLVRWRLAQPFRVPSTTISLEIMVSLHTSPSQ